MRGFSKYDIIGFFSSTILYFCFVFSILKFANFSPILPKSNSLNFENVMMIDINNFNFLNDNDEKISEQKNFPNDINKNLQKDDLVENENLQNFTDDLVEKEVLQEIVPKSEPILQPKQTLAKPKKQENAKIKKSKNSVNLDSQSANLGGNLNNINSANSLNLNQNTNKIANSDISAILKTIISKYAKQNYPSEARKLRQTGSVEIGFYYTKERRIENLQILQSSGFLNLDNAALNAVKKTKSKFPKPDKSDYFTLSINFTLTN